MKLRASPFVIRPEDLKNIWICRDCHSSFAFVSDLDDHKKETMHKKIMRIDLETGKLMTGREASNVQVGGELVNICACQQ